MPLRHYLDHAATTAITPAARTAVDGAMADWANPSSPHTEGRAARAALEAARARIAAAYGWPFEVILTSGASESLGRALGRTAMTRRLVSAVEHDSVFRVVGDCGVVPVGRDGVIDLDALDAGLAAGPTLVAIQWANSETGVRQPIADIAAMVRVAGGALLVDAAQMPADASLADHADLVALSAHKRGGPPGVGALLVRDLKLLQPTGGQERGYRPGTENVPGAIGYAAALQEAEPLERWSALRARLDDAIVRSGGAVVGADAPRHPAIGSYRMPGVAATTQLIRFDLGGIAVSAGSACASGSMKPSHVLCAMGWHEPDIREVIRISFGRDTGDADIDAAIALWRQVAREGATFAA